MKNPRNREDPERNETLLGGLSKPNNTAREDTTGRGLGGSGDLVPKKRPRIFVGCMHAAGFRKAVASRPGGSLG